VTFKKVSWIKLIVHVAAWSWIFILVFDYIAGKLSINPIQAVTQRTGKAALIFLMLSLACTPINTLFGFNKIIQARRWLGLYAFFFASLHLLTFIGLDYGFNFSLLKYEFVQKRYILVGSLAFLLLIPLAITSFRWRILKHKQNWKRLHRLVYLIGALVIVHFGWVSKGDFFRLQGDVWEPFLFGVFFLLLLIIRVPQVSRSITNFRTNTR